MKIIDLTHKISADMPVYPGTEKPVLAAANTLEKDGFAEAKITMYSHTGTHIDAPAHMIQKGPALDSFEIEQFAGSAAVLDFSQKNLPAIRISDLQPFEAILAGSIDFLIIRTGWEQYWESEKYYDGFPCLDNEATVWLTRFNLKGIGVDAISLDPVNSTDFTVHKLLLNKNILIIENLCNLEAIESERFLFLAMPLNISNGDGAPVRALAFQLETPSNNSIESS
ncbi:MAG: cyclase family protein [Syntrophomonas sp.]